MDAWACSRCHSINRPSAPACYSCGRRRDLSDLLIGEHLPGVDTPATDRGREPAPAWEAVTSRPVAPVRYRPAGVLAWIVVGLLLVSVGLSAWLAWRYGGESATPFLLAEPGALDELGDAILLGFVRTALWIVTAVAWFMWFDIVLRNVPALGGGWPGSSRLGAVGWWFVPIAWWWKPLQPVADVYRRLAVPGSPGPWLPILWWIAWLAFGWLPTVAGFATGLSFGFGGGTLEEVSSTSVTLDLIGVGLEVVAGILACAVVISLQRAQDVRVESIRQERASLPPTPGHVPTPPRSAASPTQPPVAAAAPLWVAPALGQPPATPAAQSTMPASAPPWVATAPPPGPPPAQPSTYPFEGRPGGPPPGG